MLRHATFIAVVVALVVGFTAPSTDVSVDELGWSVPGHAQETDPVGSLNWLPPNANEEVPAFDEHRLIVTYDESLGLDGELLAKGAFGLKFSTTALMDVGTGDPFPLTMLRHSPHVSSLESGQGAPDGADDYFMGVSGDVRDGDCANLAEGPDALSYAYSTTFTVSGDVAAEDCQVIEDQATDVDGNIVSTTITEYVPGFWIDVRWGTEINPLGESGHHLAEVWYSAMFDTDGEDGEFYATSDDTGSSRSVGGPLHFDLSFTMSATPGGMSGPECYDWIPENAPGSVTEQTVDLSGYSGKTITIKLWNKLDWDLFVDDAAASGGGGAIAEETHFAAFEPREWDLRGCNFAGEHEVLVTITID
ncbi:MAG: hypothetical protein KY469_07265 [Actinobacteria bacterium]|nr:hypothetical protein [Actinomycetota bacterium]